MKRILYIEDEPDQVKVVKDHLEIHGYEVIAAPDGEEGIKIAREDRPDLIIVDIFLPKIQGFDVCKSLRKFPETRKIPIIVLTASGVEYVEAQSKLAGADECVRKPYEAETLLKTVKLLIKE